MTVSKPLSDLLNKLEVMLPDISHASDLIATGLFSLSQLQRGRVDGNSPPFLKMRGRYVYLKKDVIDWLKECRSPNTQDAAAK